MRTLHKPGGHGRRAFNKGFSWKIQQVFARRRGWFEQLRAFVAEDPAARYEPFVQAAGEYFTECLEVSFLSRYRVLGSMVGKVRESLQPRPGLSLMS